jgi:hypothetical protein
MRRVAGGPLTTDSLTASQEFYGKTVDAVIAQERADEKKAADDAAAQDAAQARAQAQAAAQAREHAAYLRTHIAFHFDGFRKTDDSHIYAVVAVTNNTTEAISGLTARYSLARPNAYDSSQSNVFGNAGASDLDNLSFSDTLLGAGQTMEVATNVEYPQVSDLLDPAVMRSLNQNPVVVTSVTEQGASTPTDVRDTSQ